MLYEVITHTAVGEDLQKHRVLDPAIYDMGLLYSVTQGIGATLDLGNHPAGNRFIADQAVHLGDGNAWQQILRAIENPWCIGQQDQFLGVEGRRHSTGHQIGVDIVAFPFGADPHRGDHRQIAAVFKGLEQVGVNPHHVADETDIDLLV